MEWSRYEENYGRKNGEIMRKTSTNILSQDGYEVQVKWRVGRSAQEEVERGTD